MDFKDMIKEFSVVIYGNLEPYNAVLSKARCRIFYKKMNRNGTYITDDFADKLLSTIVYTPIKGIYEDDDYTDHGEERDLGRIYGIVPKDYNLAWEEHLDSDGVKREYACVDVLLYTGLYKEALEIVGKSLSMELYVPSIKGDFKVIDGKKAFVFEDACFVGLQVLGDEVEPCFEGAAFYTLFQDLKQMIKNLEQCQINYQNNDNREDKMAINFKLSDGKKEEQLFKLLNPNFNESGDWTMDYSICDVYDEYAICYNYEQRFYERVYYTKDDESETVEIGSKVQVFIVDVTEEEKKTLETVQALNGGSYNKLDEVFTKVEKLEEENSNYELKNKEQEETISTLTSDKTNFENQCNEAQNTIASLNEELQALKDYKLEKENEAKKSIIDKYSKQLDEETLEKYNQKITEYSVIDLDKELAFELINANPNIFNSQTEYVPKDTVPTSGVESILEKYRK